MGPGNNQAGLMEEIATGQMRYDMLVLNLVLEFLHVHTSRSVVVCIRNVCMLTYVMMVYLIAGEMEMFLGRCLSLNTCRETS